MAHRFFYPELPEAGSFILKETEAHHLAHVLRLEPNDVVSVFNGDGLVATCRIHVIRKRDVELKIEASQRDVMPQSALTIATAVPKGDRFDWLIEKATELGVRRLIPLVTSRSVVDPRAGKLDKLRQTVVAASKQSGRNHLMEIACVTSWADFVKQAIPSHRVLVAHPMGSPLNSVALPIADGLIKPLVAIGPEGGFNDDEIQLAISGGAEIIDLGPRLLRIETAAIALAAKFLL